MAHKILDFYDPLAEHYHLIFDDWEKSIERQAIAYNRLIASTLPQPSLKILDCSCGIGTQSIGLARMGHRVVASDLSPMAVARASREAENRRLKMNFCVSDLTSLAEIEDRDFDVVATLDNALPHLEAPDVRRAVCAMASKLRPGGLLMASIRDYDALMVERPTVLGPTFYGSEQDRRIVLQVWDWISESRYTLHLYITVRSETGWTSYHFVSEYRCMLRNELSGALSAAELEETRWLMPAETGLYLPVVLARKTHA
ncbi:MAG TPA: class I SAM-dependent methyltransferase [Terracidiphilus sp.]|nr:class I SAM-dependent methyltransferase [Terracidiphilus sp.]